MADAPGAGVTKPRFEPLVSLPAGGLVVELEPSHNIVIRDGNHVTTISDVEGLRWALATALEYRHVAETVARDAEQASRTQ